jgi:hypothetical protein
MAFLHSSVDCKVFSKYVARAVHTFQFRKDVSLLSAVDTQKNIIRIDVDVNLLGSNTM